MKKWVLIPVLACLVSFHAFATAAETTSEEEPENFFISHDQFMTLTNAEQKTYVKKVKELIGEMAESYPYFNEEMSARSSLYQNLWSMTIAPAQSSGLEGYTNEQLGAAVMNALTDAQKYSAEVSDAKLSTLSPEEQQLAVEKYKQSIYHVAIAANYTNYMTNRNIKINGKVQSVNKIVEAASKAVLSNEEKIKTVAKSESDVTFARDEILKPAMNGQMNVTSSFPAPGLVYYGEKIPGMNDTTEISKKVVATEAASGKDIPPLPKAVTPAKPTSKPDPKKKDAKLPVNTVGILPIQPGEQALPAPTKIETPAANANYYRCVYAGFVIKKDPCVAPSQLPWKLNGLSDKDFICAKGTVMCNPFVFGFSANCDWLSIVQKGGSTASCFSSAKPYCIKPSMSATKSCTSLSQSDNSLQAAVELIKMNEKAFNQFGKSFSDICDKNLIDFNSYPRKRTPQNKQRTVDDITKTCNVAKIRMKDIEKRYAIYRKPKLPGTNVKSLMKVKPVPTGKELLMQNAPQSGKQ